MNAMVQCSNDIGARWLPAAVRRRGEMGKPQTTPSHSLVYCVLIKLLLFNPS
jgi:hypothetical protein